jgi:CRISPR-associated protein Cmr5
MTQQTTISFRTLDQERAKHAWEAVRFQVASPKSQEADDYAREAKKLPVRIMTAGLGQALACIVAKSRESKPGLGKLDQDLSEWTLKRVPASAGKRALLESIMEGDADFLRRATDETLAYLNWLNRFTEAEGLPRKKGDD